MENKLKFNNARLPLVNEDCLFQLEVENGKWVRIQQQTEYLRNEDYVSIDELPSDASKNGATYNQLDLEGKILLPGFVDSHMHLDKSFSLTTIGNLSGTLEEACINYGQAAPSFTKAEIKARIMRSALQSLSYGTTHIRTHLDFSAATAGTAKIAMNTIEAALEVKETLAPYMTLQLIPMCSYPLPAVGLDILEEVLRMGVDGIGGAPHMSANSREQIDFIFKMAMKADCLIDLHADENDNPSIRTVEYIAKLTKEYDIAGRVTVDHLCSLASMPDKDASTLIEAMVSSGLKAVSLPAVNLYLQGRQDSFPVRRGVTRLKQLWEAGVPVAIASDNIHDPFHPFGRGDLVQIGLISAYAAHMGSPADLRTLLRMITDVPASILGMDGYGIEQGLTANFVVLDSHSPDELFTLLPERRWVYSNQKWLRIAAPKTNWNEPRLNEYWDQACDIVSFNK
ncbi:amidohydrolase [Paenibacillus psychroresistens]|uniref:Amidohydrolase n=1 Tax=Paenibacillus psychroresistens TaxID=1778678 RepID=A0A6B8RSQ4_9BACL|nr:amidohydrolase family protein [Paenibacillus psychroresistens]QGQ98336.1 amidohydrolase [Paenibacillus psychroresistens]